MKNSKFNCAMGLMYLAVRKMWQNCKLNITEMHNFKNKYTDAFCDARIAEVDAAEAMPTEEARAAAHSMLRLELMTIGKTCRQDWQSLKMYIKTAFAPEQWQIQWDAAGMNSYYDAGNNNWTSLTELMSEGSAYIAANSAVLLAGDNMPAGFEAQFNASKDALNDKFSEFTVAEVNAEFGQEQKMDASNSVYDQAIMMGEDGFHLFDGEVLKQNMFSFAAVCELIDPRGSSTAILTVLNATTGMPMIAEVELVGSDRKVTSGADGRVEMGHLAQGENSFKVTADGFTTQTVTLNLNVGATSRTEVEMAPMFGETVSEVTPIPGAEPVPVPVS